MRRGHIKKEDRGTENQRRSSLPPPVAKHKLPPEGILSADMAAPPALVIVGKEKTNQRFLEAAYNCDFEQIKILSEAVDMDTQDEIGNTALMHVVSACDVESTKFLIEKGADVDISDKDGKTALMIACEYGELGIAKLLVENKADVNAVDEKDRSALDYAVKNNNHEIAEFLRKNDAWE